MGAETDSGYASDITRTWPVNGKFSSEQKAIYELVLASQEAAFAEIAPNKHWNQAHEPTVRVITSGLVKLGLLQGDVDELIAALLRLESDDEAAVRLTKAAELTGLHPQTLRIYERKGLLDPARGHPDGSIRSARAERQPARTNIPATSTGATPG